MKIALLLTGDELMGGDLIDSNSAYLASEIKALGFRVGKMITLGDDLEILSTEIRELAASYEVIIINGGLGPTVDDYTSEAIAKAFGKKLGENPLALEQLKRWVEGRGFKINPSNLKQVLLPEGAQPVENLSGSAPGIFFRAGSAVIYATPGVPHEMKKMWESRIRKDLLQRTGASPVKTRVFRTFGIGESTLQDRINERVSIPSQIKLGFRASMPYVEVKTTFSEADHAAAETVHAELRNLFGDYIFSESSLTLSETVAQILQKSDKKLSVAESCTGGYLSSLFTLIPGVSRVFSAGLTAYCNPVKQSVLGVGKETLDAHGAVSGETAQAMLTGLLKKTGSDYGIATTGVAGPGKAENDPEVGTIYIAWGSSENIRCRKLRIRAQRERFIRVASHVALDVFRRFLIDSDEKAPYIYDLNNPYQ